MNNLSEWERGDDRHLVLGEVVLQLLGRHDDSVEKFLCLRVPRLGVGQHFANEVNGSLDLKGMFMFFPFDHQGGADHMVSGS